VASRSGGARDVVRHLETGLLYDAGDPYAFRRSVAALAGDRHRALLGQHGRELAAGRDWCDAVDELVTGPYAALKSTRSAAAA
jgi:phosphatidylinositol alpha 1,6-mannosyltransferase